MHVYSNEIESMEFKIYGQRRNLTNEAACTLVERSELEKYFRKQHTQKKRRSRHIRQQVTWENNGFPESPKQWRQPV